MLPPRRLTATEHNPNKHPKPAPQHPKLVEPSSFVSQPAHVLGTQVDRADLGVPEFDPLQEGLDIDWPGTYGSLQPCQNLAVQAAAVANRRFLE